MLNHSLISTVSFVLGRQIEGKKLCQPVGEKRVQGGLGRTTHFLCFLVHCLIAFQAQLLLLLPVLEKIAAFEAPVCLQLLLSSNWCNPVRSEQHNCEHVLQPHPAVGTSSILSSECFLCTCLPGVPEECSAGWLCSHGHTKRVSPRLRYVHLPVEEFQKGLGKCECLCRCWW